MELTLCFITLQTVLLVSAYPKGGPLSICNDPYPHHHGVSRSTEPSPYSIELNQTSYKPGDAVKVTIKGNIEMEGVQIAAHSTGAGNWEVLYGEFTDFPSTIQPYKYYSNVVNCLTHREELEGMNQVDMVWKAPDVSVGDLLFSATILKDFDLFWVNISALITAEVQANNTFKKPIENLGYRGFDSDLSLENCGKASGCVTFPQACTADSCRFSVSYKTVNDGIRFRMTSRQAAITNSYISLGISEDVWMDKDETFTCMDIGGSLEFAQGYNPSWYNVKVRSEAVSDVVIQSVDGAISCEFTRKVSAPIALYGFKGLENKTIDYSDGLDAEKYHVYLAWGVTYLGAKETVEKHLELPIVSRNKVAFNSNIRNSFYNLHDTVRVHGTFMVISWFGAAAIAMIIARYFKDGFVNSAHRLCGLKPWFQVHRGLVIISAVLTAISFIIIFVHYIKLTKEYLLHAGFGITLMILTVIQIIVGMIRPDPTSGKRILFNWFHRISGMLCYLLAAVSMFLGANIDYMSPVMKTTGTGLLVGLIVTQAVFALVFEFMSCSGSSRNTNGNNNGHVNGQVNGTTPTDKSMEIEEPEVKSASNPYVIKFSLFTLYAALIVSLLVCFLVVLWLY